MQRYTLYLPTIKKSKTGATDITNFCDTDMLSITSLWKAEKEVFYFITNICLVQSCYSSLQTLMWDADEPYFISWQIFVIKFKSHDMYIVPYDKYLRDAKVVYFMTNICEMQRLCILWQIFVRCRAGGKYLTVDTSHSPQWQSATSQGCPWPWRRGNALFLNKSWKQWLLLFCPFICQCTASWSYWSIAVSCTRLKGKCPMSIFSAICNRFALKCILLDHQWPALCSKNILLKSNKVRSQEFIKTSSWHIELQCLRILIFCVQGMRSFQNADCGVNMVCCTQIRVLRSTSIKRQLEWAQHETNIQRDTLK